MATHELKAGTEDDSNKYSELKANLTKKKTEMKTGTRKCKKNISYKDLLDHRKGYVNQYEAKTFRLIFRGDRKASLDMDNFNAVLHVAGKVIRMSAETFNEGFILATVSNILAHLSSYCDTEDRFKQVETFASSIKTKFSEEKIEKAILQVKYALRPAVVALLKPSGLQPHKVGAEQDVHAAFRTVDLRPKDLELNIPSSRKRKPGLYVTFVFHLRHFISSRMSKILLVFQDSKDEAIQQLIDLQYEEFKVQCDSYEFKSLGKVIHVLLTMDPQKENLYLTFDCLIWMRKLTKKSNTRKELTFAAARDFWKRRGTMWVVKWIADNTEAADLTVGVELLVYFIETIDLSSEWITELLKKNDSVPGLQKSIERRFLNVDRRAKEDLVNQIVNYLLKENLSTETNMNMLIADLLVNLLWMTYYDQRLLFNVLFETLDGLTVYFHGNPCYKIVALLYSWFKAGTISPFLIDHVKEKTSWFCKCSTALFFEFCLAVTEPHFLNFISNEFKEYFIHPVGALFLQYILNPPSIAFNDTLKRRTQEERLTTIESMRKALIPTLYALIEEKPAGTFLSLEVRCSLTSKLIMNLNDPEMLRNVVKKITDFVFSSRTRTLSKTYPWIFRLLRENIAMDTFLYSVQMSEEETEYFSDMFLDFFPSEGFVQHARSSVWRSLVLMLIETKIPSVLSKVRNRLKHLRPSTGLKSSAEIAFWQTVSDLE